MPFHKKHLVENYEDIIEKIFMSLTGSSFSFHFILEEEWNKDDDDDLDIKSIIICI